MIIINTKEDAETFINGIIRKSKEHKKSMPIVYTTKEVAKMLKTTEQHISQLVRNGELKPISERKRYRVFSDTEIENFINNEKK